MIPLLLLNKILQLFTIMAFGFILVKLKIIKSSDSNVLSKISLYMLMPAIIINSFDIELTEEIATGLKIGLQAVIVIHVTLLLLDIVYKKIFKGTSTERASIIYSNAGNLIIPIVSFVLGEDWVIYSCVYLTVQIVLLWTHGISLFSPDKMSIKKIILNVNIISVAIGLIMLLSGIRLPVFVKDIASSLSSMIGTVGMIIASMLAANVDYKKMLANKRLYLVVLMRMVVCPLIILLIVKGIFMNVAAVNKYEVDLIALLASMTPSAATVLQFAQLNNKDADFAPAVNIF